MGNRLLIYEVRFYAIAYFSKMGYTVNIPITDSQDYDLIIDREGKLLKVQVKTTKFKIRDGVYQVSLKTYGGNRSGQTIKNFNENGSDLLFVLTDEGTTYLIPKEDIHSNTCINLNTTLADLLAYINYNTYLCNIKLKQYDRYIWRQSIGRFSKRRNSNGRR